MSRLLYQLSYTAVRPADGTTGHGRTCRTSPFTESNRRPSPYHGDALPSELKGHRTACMDQRVRPCRGYTRAGRDVKPAGRGPGPAASGTPAHRRLPSATSPSRCAATGRNAPGEGSGDRARAARHDVASRRGGQPGVRRRRATAHRTLVWPPTISRLGPPVLGPPVLGRSDHCGPWPSAARNRVTSKLGYGLPQVRAGTRAARPESGAAPGSIVVAGVGFEPT